MFCLLFLWVCYHVISGKNFMLEDNDLGLLIGRPFYFDGAIYPFQMNKDSMSKKLSQSEAIKIAEQFGLQVTELIDPDWQADKLRHAMKRLQRTPADKLNQPFDCKTISDALNPTPVKTSHQPCETFIMIENTSMVYEIRYQSQRNKTLF